MFYSDCKPDKIIDATDLDDDELEDGPALLESDDELTAPTNKRCVCWDFTWRLFNLNRQLMM